MGLVSSLIESIPLFYLGILCILDLHKQLHLKIFFCSIVDNIYESRKPIRKNFCDNFGKSNDPCPIFSELGTHKINCPKSFLNHNATSQTGPHLFWGIVKEGIEMYHQATFLEIIAIQLIILAAVVIPDSLIIAITSLAAGVILLLVGIGIYTYSLKVTSRIFALPWTKLGIIIGVFIIFISVTSMNNISDFDPFVKSFLISQGVSL
jgi:hypothetical protein